MRGGLKIVWVETVELSLQFGFEKAVQGRFFPKH